MKLMQTYSLGAWLLIALNLLMALGSIWVFMRMAPAIKVIIEQNERSLHACEDMLSSLAMVSQIDPETTQYEQSFSEALKDARNNVTEKEEPIALDTISEHYTRAFKGDSEAKKRTVSAVTLLSEINREAMVIADRKARHLGNAGAWGVVFMATAIFGVGILFTRNMNNYIANSLEEIHSVISAFQNGETMRRCTGPDAPHEIKFIFNGVNELLDKNCVNSLGDQKTWEQ